MRLPRLLVQRRRRLFLLLLGNGFGQGAVAVVVAWSIMQLFERQGGADSAAAAPVLLVLAASILLSALFRRWERIHAEMLGQDYVRSVRAKLYHRLLQCDSRGFEKNRKGAILLKFVGDILAMRRWISLGVARLLVSGISIGVALLVLISVHWPFALGILIILSLAAAWVAHASRALHQAISEKRRCQAALSANVGEKINRLATVQAFGQEAREERLLRRQSDRLAATSVTQASRVGNLRAVTDFAAGSCLVFVLAAAAWQPAGEVSAGMLAAVISVIGLITPPLRDLGRSLEYWMAAQVAIKNLVAGVSDTKRLKRRHRSKPLQFTQGEISLRRVSFGHVLRRVTLRAPGGSRIAVLGRNGSGKTTLLTLLARYTSPDSGRILIDGQDLSRVQLSSLRRQIAFVGLDVPLLSGSLKKNLCYGAGIVDEDSLQEVLLQCALTSLVAHLPGGLDGRIMENGSNLSQGERIRVLLARALLMRPKCLLLDEADAHLDRAARRALDEVVQGFTGTLVMATHRRSMIRKCDQVWRMRKGDVVVSGPERFETDKGNVVALSRGPMSGLAV